MTDSSPAWPVFRIDLRHLQVVLNGSDVVALGSVEFGHLRVVLESDNCRVLILGKLSILSGTHLMRCIAIIGSDGRLSQILWGLVLPLNLKEGISLVRLLLWLLTGQLLKILVGQRISEGCLGLTWHLQSLILGLGHLKLLVWLLGLLTRLLLLLELVVNRLRGQRKGGLRNDSHWSQFGSLNLLGALVLLGHVL